MAMGQRGKGCITKQREGGRVKRNNREGLRKTKEKG